MARLASEVSSIQALARRIEGEIRTRGLRPGERFMTTEEVGQMLGVSGATAHRAMNHLVRRELLIRYQGRGTFVGRLEGEPQSPATQIVHILLPEDQRELVSVELDVLIEAVRAHVGRVNVQMSFLPSKNAGRIVRDSIQSAQQPRHYAGAIPISCPRDVYRVLSEARVPTVVLGSLYADQRHIPSVDIDHLEAGRLLAEYLLRGKHRRIALLATGSGRPGDDAFYDGVSDALTRATLPHNTLIVRAFPHDFDAFRSQVSELLSGPDHPTGIICRSERLVGVVAATVAAAGLVSPRDVEIVFQTQSCRPLDRSSYTHVRPKESFKWIADALGEMLQRIGQGQPLAQQHVIVPVELCKSNARINGGL